MSEKKQKGKSQSQQIEYLKTRLTKRNLELKYLKKTMFFVNNYAIPICGEFLILHKDSKEFTAGFNTKERECSCKLCEMAQDFLNYMDKN